VGVVLKKVYVCADSIDKFGLEGRYALKEIDSEDINIKQLYYI